MGDEGKTKAQLIDELVKLRQEIVKLENLEIEGKRAEEALQESEWKYKTLTEGSLTGVFIYQGGRYVFVNDRFAEIHGYEPEELLGKDHLTLIHPDESEVIKQRASQRLKGEEVPQRYEVKRRRKDGKAIWCEMMATRIQYKGSPAVIGNVIDITGRKRAEQEIRELSSAVEQSIDGIAISDLEPKLTFVNEAFARMHGYSPQEMIGMKVVNLHNEEQMDEYKIRMNQIKTQGSWTGEIGHIRKDGTPFPTYMSVTLLYGNDENPTGILAVTRDITEQRRLEVQLQHAQKIEALGTLAGGIAHDFNNLLMGIMGNTSLMLLETELTHPNYERLKNIEKQVRSGAKLTRQLLGFARRGKYEVKVISLNQIVEDTSEAFGRTRKEIAIHRELTKDLFAVEADEGEIEQVLLNLYVNAKDAMPAGGDLILRTMNVSHEDMRGKVYNPKPGNYVLLKVTDTGIGMDKKTMVRIFDPFFTTKTGRGTGLGLASVYGTVKAHGGYIKVDSREGHGTSFCIYLPSSEKKREEAAKNEGQILEGGGTILLVDDETAVLDVGVKMLKKLGYTVLEAKGGREAIEVYREKRGKIDMVILDMIMPGMGGGETYDRMKEINPALKVLLSSGYSLKGQVSEILERGCDGFIQKPFDITDLSRRIRQILDNR